MSSSNDPAEIYYAEFSGKAVTLRNMERRMIRKFMMQSEVVNAQVSGSGANAKVAIVMKNGKTYVYGADGRLIRR